MNMTMTMTMNMNMNMNTNMKKKNDMSGIKYRALTYLHSSLLKQKENLKKSFNSIVTFDQKEYIERHENERNCHINNLFQSNIEKKNNIRVPKSNNSSTRNTTGTGTGTDSRTGSVKIVNAMSKNSKSHLILSCKWLLQVTIHTNTINPLHSTLFVDFHSIYLLHSTFYENFKIRF